MSGISDKSKGPKRLSFKKIEGKLVVEGDGGQPPCVEEFANAYLTYYQENQSDLGELPLELISEASCPAGHIEKDRLILDYPTPINKWRWQCFAFASVNNSEFIRDEVCGNLTKEERLNILRGYCEYVMAIQSLTLYKDYIPLEDAMELLDYAYPVNIRNNGKSGLAVLDVALITSSLFEIGLHLQKASHLHPMQVLTEIEAFQKLLDGSAKTMKRFLKNRYSLSATNIWKPDSMAGLRVLATYAHVVSGATVGQIADSQEILDRIDTVAHWISDTRKDLGKKQHHQFINAKVLDLQPPAFRQFILNLDQLLAKNHHSVI